jgi:hypothetical protein
MPGPFQQEECIRFRLINLIGIKRHCGTYAALAKRVTAGRFVIKLTVGMYYRAIGFINLPVV